MFMADALVQSTPVISEDKIFFVDVLGNIYSYGYADGELNWKYSMASSTLASPIIVGDLLVVGGNDGNLRALGLNDGEERWTLALSGWLATAAVSDSGKILIGSDNGSVYAVNSRSGEVEWTVPTGGGVRSSPIIHNGTAYVGSDDNHMYGLSIEDGAINWRFRTGSSIRSSPLAVGGTLYFGSQDNYVYAIDLATRRQLWRFDTGYAISTQPEINENLIFQGNDRGDLNAIDVRTGTSVWWAEVGGAITSTEVISGSRIIVGSEDRNIRTYLQETGERLWHFTSTDAVVGGSLEYQDANCIGSHKSIICLTGGTVVGTGQLVDRTTQSAAPDLGGPTSMSDCESLRSNAAQFGFCRVQLAGDLSLSLGVEEVCEGTGDWGAACRQAWAVSRAEEHQSGWSRDSLLAACLDNSDCAFEVLDHRRSQDLFEQLAMCHEHAGEFTNDCAIHALDRWIHNGPSLADVQRLAELPYFRVQVGQYSASSSVCWGIGDCPVDDIGGAACSQRRAELQDNEQLCRRLR